MNLVPVSRSRTGGTELLVRDHKRFAGHIYYNLAPRTRGQDYNIYARCTSNGSVQTVLYLQYGTSSKVPDSYAYQSLFIVP